MALPRHRWTPEEYLAFEIASDKKHEYFDGEVYDMVGFSPKHNIIAGNILASLGIQLRDSPALVFPSMQRIHIPETGLYTYPDCTVVGADARYENDTLVNPRLVVEVCSPLTELYERGDKLTLYRKSKSIQEVVFVDCESREVTHYQRQSDESWLISITSGAEAIIDLPSIGCTLALSDVYRKVTFDESELE